MGGRRLRQQQSEESPIYPSVHEHIFNDDLLANAPDYEDAKRQFPSIIHVLHHPELQKYFDDLANAAKARSRKWGAAAIWCGAIAIALAAAEIILQSYRRDLDPSIGSDWENLVAWTIAVAAALSGIVSVLIGKMGVLYGSRKSEWLQNRFMTERIRQFHFETFVARLPQIVASLQGDDDATRIASVEEYVRQRSEWFAIFQSELKGKVGAVLSLTLDTRGSHVSQHEATELDHSTDHKELEPLFKAYCKYRIMHQLKYTADKLGTSSRFLTSGKPRDQAAILRGINSWGIGVLFFVHIFVLGSVIFYALMSNSGNFLSAFSPISGPFNAIIILIAILALVARAFEQGLQPEREIERYQQYLSNVTSVLERFNKAKTQNEAIGVMRDMERLSFYEMCDFLVTNNDAVFVM
jgi:hypothetical protein